MDETIDNSLKYQLVIILRYSYDNIIYERFIKYIDVSDNKTADGIFENVKKIIKEFNIEKKLIGQCYDDARVMSSGKIVASKNKKSVSQSNIYILLCSQTQYCN